MHSPHRRVKTTCRPRRWCASAKIKLHLHVRLKIPKVSAGCRAFTLELRRVVWPGKFKPDLPPRYDGTPDPAEFLQLYELSTEAANDNEKVMAN